MKGAASLWTVAKRSCGGPRIDAEMKMKLVDGLELGDLEKQGPAVGQDMRRADGQRVVARHAGVPRSRARASRSRCCSDSSRPGRNGCRAARRLRGRAGG